MTERETIVVKRRFAVWLEDAFRVPRPSAEELADFDGDLNDWAYAQVDGIYERANDTNDPTVTLLWEDEHKADLDFPEDEVFVEEDA